MVFTVTLVFWKIECVNKHALHCLKNEEIRWRDMGWQGLTHKHCGLFLPPSGRVHHWISKSITYTDRKFDKHLSRTHCNTRCLSNFFGGCHGLFERKKGNREEEILMGTGNRNRNIREKCLFSQVPGTRVAWGKPIACVCLSLCRWLWEYRNFGNKTYTLLIQLLKSFHKSQQSRRRERRTLVFQKSVKIRNKWFCGKGDMTSKMAMFRGFSGKFQKKVKKFCRRH